MAPPISRGRSSPGFAGRPYNCSSSVRSSRPSADAHVSPAVVARAAVFCTLPTLTPRLRATSRTLHTLHALRARNPGWRLRLVIGADILLEKDKWFGWDEIERLAPPVVLGRVGHPHDDAPLPVIPEVASRDVRAMVARGDDVSAMVPRAVLEYVRANGLYQKV